MAQQAQKKLHSNKMYVQRSLTLTNSVDVYLMHLIFSQFSNTQ